MGSNAGSRRTLAGLKQRLQAAPSRTVVPFPPSDGHPACAGVVIRHETVDATVADHQHTAWDMMRALDGETGDFDRVDVVRFLAPTTRITVADTCLVLSKFKGDHGRLCALDILRNAIVDPHNWHFLGSEFTDTAFRRSARALRPDTQGPPPPDIGSDHVAVQAHTAVTTPAPSAVTTEVDGDADELREQIKMQRELVALEREATELARERARLESPWWVRLLRWVFRIDRRRT